MGFDFGSRAPDWRGAHGIDLSFVGTQVGVSGRVAVPKLADTASAQRSQKEHGQTAPSIALLNGGPLLAPAFAAQSKGATTFALSVNSSFAPRFRPPADG